MAREYIGSYRAAIYYAPNPDLIEWQKTDLWTGQHERVLLLSGREVLVPLLIYQINQIIQMDFVKASKRHFMEITQ